MVYLLMFLVIIHHKNMNTEHNNKKIPDDSNEGVLDEKRRGMLKWIAVGGGAFILGKILGPSVNMFSESSLLGKTHLFKNFRVSENSKELGFYDSFGNEILVLEKDPHAGE